jgi:phosphoribosylaminoimidazole-succinocarboxamide synthase
MIHGQDQPQPLLTTDLPLPGKRQGKVRDIYEAQTTDGQDALLIVQTDRISAFDVVMPNGIPQKGAILTQITRFWFEMIADQFGDRLAHHLLSTDPNDVAGLDPAQRDQLAGRVMVCRKTEVLPVECIVRGYITGSGWQEYQHRGTVSGIELPTGLQQCEKLPEPIFTPSTKAETGHDENISFEQAGAIVGPQRLAAMRELSLAIYQMAHDYAAQRGIILADTKFEFGAPLESDGKSIMLIDEVLTPDSSRFWPADQYKVGRDQPSFDKQYVRNYLQSLVDKGQWDKTPPAPQLPPDIVEGTTRKYCEAYERLTGQRVT